MKTTKAITLVMMALALSATPALAQRGGGGGSRGGGGGHSSSVSSSRSSSGSHSSSVSSSRSSGSSHSSSVSSSRSSGGSHSSSVSSSRSSGSSSRSVSSTSHPSSGTPSRSFEGGSRPTHSAGVSRGTEGAPGRSVVRGGVEARGSQSGMRGREAGTTGGEVARGGVNREGHSGAGKAPAGVVSASGRPSGSPGYARAGRPGGVMPPSHRPIHPAPYFYHPWTHHMVHCHPVFWDPLPPRPWYWPGFWGYCNSYWYDYHVTDVVVVRDYVRDTYHVDMVTYGISGDIMYAIVRDGGSTYLQVYDKDDHLLAEQKINKKYCNMVIDAENGGCWISKKHEKDPLLFIWADGQLLIYEAD